MHKWKREKRGGQGHSTLKARIDEENGVKEENNLYKMVASRIREFLWRGC